MTTLIFRNTVLETIFHNREIWFTSAELARALEYTETDAVTKIFNRNKDEFSECMTTTVNLGVVRKTGTVRMPVRIFSLRGAHLPNRYVCPYTYSKRIQKMGVGYSR